jgi:hypothetical protein
MNVRLGEVRASARSPYINTSLTVWLLKHEIKQQTKWTFCNTDLIHLELMSRPPLQHLFFEPGLNWWLISPTEHLHEQPKGSLHVLVQLGFNEDNETFDKVEEVF